MAAPAHQSARFTPLQRAPRSRRVLALIAGPVLWLVSIVVVGIVLDRRGSVEYALKATAIAFVVSLPICWFALIRRQREDRKAGRT